jgi:DSF synthase
MFIWIEQGIYGVIMSAVTKIKHAEVLFQSEQHKSYPQLDTFYDEKYKIGWFYMNGAPRPCFTPTLLKSLTSYLSDVKAEMRLTQQQKYDYLVVASRYEGIFNLGGDLDLFTDLIRQHDRDALFNYAVHCIDILFDNLLHFNTDLTTITLIQGDALGGGFEAALSSNIVIAEKGTKMGLPEVLFNLFPGMGAYTLLRPRVGAAKAREMILSGKLYTAEELYQLGAVDILAEQGEGDLAVYRYIDKAKKSPNSYEAMAKITDMCNPVDYDELIAIAHIWADAALKITDKDIKMMQRLVKRQTAKMSA